MSRTATPQDVLEGRARWCVVCADNAEMLPTLPQVDAVVTDPPYNEATHANALCGTLGAFKDGSDRGVGFAALSSAAALAAALVGLSRRWVVAFCAVEQMGEYANGAGAAWVRAGIWDKVAVAPQLSGDRPGQAVEGIAIMHRPGRKRWNRGGGAGIWRCVPQQGADRPDHPTPKPVKLMVDILSDFTEPGEVVLDPFCGSGTTGVACLRLGRRFIGIEKGAHYAEVARERLEAEDKGLTLRDARAGQRGLFEANA